MAVTTEGLKNTFPYDPCYNWGKGGNALLLKIKPA